jgi:phage shock protein C
METRLLRSHTDKIVAGVCGGLALYLRLDAVLVRLFFVILGLANSGIAILLYFILWLVMPEEGHAPYSSLDETLRTGTTDMADRARTIGGDLRRTMNDRPREVGLIFGVALVLFGGALLLQSLGLSWLSWFTVDRLWPVLLILGGAVLLFRQVRG